MTGSIGGTREPSRWKTILLDVVGFVAVIWIVPVAILLIGAPIALVVAGILWAVE